MSAAAASKTFHGLNLAVLGAALMLVPASSRAEWWREWRAELWHVRAACVVKTGIGKTGAAWQGEREVAKFCLGAFADAWSMRSGGAPATAPLSTARGSAAQCLKVLALIGVISIAVAAIHPNVRAKLQPAKYRLPADLTLIQRGDDASLSTPSISLKQFQMWRNQHQKLFDDFAFYRLATESIAGREPVAVAHASANLLQMLGMPVRLTAHHRSGGGTLPAVVLSEALWKREFASALSVAGRVVRLGTQDAVVAGVASESTWQLPGKVDAWILDSAANVGETDKGFVLARVSPLAPRYHWSAVWTLTAPKPDGSFDDFRCVEVWDHATSIWATFLFALVLACLALPATTPLAPGEHLLSTRKIPRSTMLRRWAFLLGKISLLLPIVFFLSLDVAYAHPGVTAASAEYTQFLCVFVVSLLGLRWAIRDQRSRCPECLGRLTHPARVGQPSRNFLAWNGTELMCVGGHGLLHVPELATSWFSTQRWMYLDASWDILFAEPRLFSTSYF